MRTIQIKKTNKISQATSDNLLPHVLSYDSNEQYAIINDLILSVLDHTAFNQAYLFICTKDSFLFKPLLALGDLTISDKRLFKENIISVPDKTNYINKISNSLECFDFFSEEYSERHGYVYFLRSKNLIWGMLILCHSQLIKEISSKDQHFGLSISNTLAYLLSSEHLYETLHRRLTVTQSLHQVSETILETPNIDELLITVSDEALRLSQANGAAIYLLQNNNLLSLACSSGKLHFLKHVQFNNFLYRYAINSENEGIFLDELSKSFYFDNEVSPQALLTIPIQANNEIMAVLIVVNLLYPFTESEQRTIRLLGDQAGHAFEYTQLYEQAEKFAVLRERQRLSRDLHDSVNQLLYAIMLYAKASRREVEHDKLDQAKSHIEELIQTTKEALGEMRLLIYELRPPILEKQGLSAALEERVRFVEGRTGINPHFTSTFNSRLPQDIEENLYRITQEALNNIVKHANASNVTLEIREIRNKIIISLSDDGIGFDYQKKKSEKGHLGLDSMQERAERIGAILSIDSQPGIGTQVKIEVNR
jgi:signal transduction histidine kinase